jgi:hypothetical protein
MSELLGIEGLANSAPVLFFLLALVIVFLKFVKDQNKIALDALHARDAALIEVMKENSKCIEENTRMLGRAESAILRSEK